MFLESDSARSTWKHLARYLAKEKGQMVPPDYSVYFMTMASVGATLFGLIFVLISIAPASISIGLTARKRGQE